MCLQCLKEQNLEYENIHCHSFYSNIMTPDSITSRTAIAQRAVELNQKTISSVEHGYGGNVFDFHTIAKQHDLKLIFGVEFYYVKDRFEKDRTNAHILVVAKNETGRKAMNTLISEANSTGYYMKPRIDESLLFSLPPNDVIVTTACIASPINKYENYAEYFILKAKEYFGDNFFLEVQPHNHDLQKEFNAKLLEYRDMYDVPLILGVDSHYIYEEDSEYRDILLKSKKINYPEEDGFILDFPTVDTLIDRFESQQVLNAEQLKEAFDNTLIVRDFQGVELDTEVKMITIYPELTHEEKSQKLKELINQQWKEDRKHIPKEKWKEYIKAIQFETDIITETNMEDYFLFNYEAIKRGVEEYGGILTKTGRGCFTEDALVHTKVGLKSIKDVEVGDYVINKLGEWDKVINTWQYNIKEPMIEIQYQQDSDSHPVVATYDHKILVKDMNGKIAYRQAKDLSVLDMVCQPILKSDNVKKLQTVDLSQYTFEDDSFNEERVYSAPYPSVHRFINLDEYFYYLIGLLNGSYVRRSNNCFILDIRQNKYGDRVPLNMKYVKHLMNKFDIKIANIDVENYSETRLIVPRNLSEFIQREYLVLPKITRHEKLLNIHVDYLEKLYEGLLCARGGYNLRKDEEYFNNIDTDLLYFIKTIAMKLSYSPFKLQKSYEKYNISRRKSLQNTNFIGQDYVFLPIKQLIHHKPKRQVVYDLQVENDPSFTIYNMVVHNSAPSMYVNKLFGFTEIDRLESPIELYPTRFMSKSRILETKSLPDIDFNTANAEPFVKASKDIIGDKNCYQMIAFGTMKEKDAFKTYCRGLDLPLTDVITVSEDLDKYRSHKQWGKIIKRSEKFIGVVTSYSPHPCFTKDELVTTEKGLVKISDIQVGDKVLTHKGNFKRVLHTMVNDSDDVYRFEVQGSLPTEVTGTHPFYTLEKESTDGKMEWKAVEDISKGTMIGTFVNTSSIIPQFTGLPTDDKNFWWIVGRFLGDGWLKNPRKKYAKQEYISIICCGKHEIGEIEKYADELKYAFNYYRTEERTTYRYNFMSKALYGFLGEFGSGAKNKKVPQFVLDLPEDLLKSFLDGYVSADGHIAKNKIIIDTVSKQLAIGIQNVLHKVYKQGSTIATYHRKNQYIEGRPINTSKHYHVVLTISDRKKSFYKDGYIWNPFKKKTKLEDVYTTYNIEVEDDNSYTVNNMAVHNCAFLLLSDDINTEIGTVKAKDGNQLALIDSYNSDVYKYLKNDLLTVTVYGIIGSVYKAIGHPIDDVRTLIKKTENDERIWKLFEDGIVATLNQAGTNSGKPQIMQYKPKSIRDLSMWVAAIRPSFATLKDMFLNRKPFSYNIPELDDLLQTSDNFILFQENIMTVLQYAGFPEDETYGLLKAIAKKKPGIIEPIHDRFIKGFVEKTGSEENALEVWKIIENAVG